MSRFDYVEYDELAVWRQKTAKELFMNISSIVESYEISRPQSIALTKLEEAYMWIGKAIRDDQIARNNSVKPQEQRTNS